MSMEHVGLLADLAIIFTVSLVVVLLFHRFRLPPVPGFIVAGVLLGPNALGLVNDVTGVERLADVGVILLLFTVGIEFSAGRLRALGPARAGRRPHTSHPDHTGGRRRVPRLGGAVANRVVCRLPGGPLEHPHPPQDSPPPPPDRPPPRPPAHP